MARKKAVSKSVEGSESKSPKGKKKPKQLKVSGDEHAKLMLQHLMGVSQKSSTTVGDNSFLSVAIPCPLAIQFLLGISGWPLGLLIQLIGDKGARKTTFLFEIIRWFAMRQGSTSFTLTESKYSWPLQFAVTGLPNEYPHARVKPYCSTNMQDWQVHLMGEVDHAIKMMDHGFTLASGDKVPKGCYIPYLFGIDSLVSQLTEGQAKTIDDQGGQERGFATHIKSLSDWLSAITPKIACRPFSVVGINHCTIDKPDQWTIHIKEKGGRKLAYLSSLIIYLERISNTKSYINEPGWNPLVERSVIKFQLTKSSIGSETARISVPLVTKKQILGTGKSQDRSWFQWGQALVWILEAHMEDGAELKLSKGPSTARDRGIYAARINSVAPFSRVPNTTDMAICKKYGGDTPMTLEVLGCHMQADPEFVAMFYELFGINEYPLWTVDMDFVDFLAQAREQIYGQRVLAPTAVVDPAAVNIPGVS